MAMHPTRYHTEWLNLISISGPFLSLPVLCRVFPQGLEAHDPDLSRRLRSAYPEWQERGCGSRADVAYHRAWVEFVLGEVLEYPAEFLATGADVPPGIEASLPEHGVLLRPDHVLMPPAGRSGEPGERTPVLLIQQYPAAQSLEAGVSGERWKAAPATRMQELLRGSRCPLGLVTNGEEWMLVHAPLGESAGFITWRADLWLEEPTTLQAFRSLLGMRRFFAVSEPDRLPALLAESAQDQQEVTDRLGRQVRRAVELLVQALDHADRDSQRSLLSDVPPEAVYEAALTVMMRLVFLFAAEERGLLLLGDPIYDAHYAVSPLRAQLREAADRQGEEVLERRHDAWARLLAAFRGVYAGIRHERLALPPYGGTLFDPDRFPFLEGRPAATRWARQPAQPPPIHNRTVLHLLEALQLLQVSGREGGVTEARRLSFLALDIEQIGHVYEGLLDHTARRAEEPILGLKGRAGDEPEIPLARLEELLSPGAAALARSLARECGRSEKALLKDLESPADPLLVTDAQRECGPDADLAARVTPFLALLRRDPLGRPVILPAGSLYVTAGAERRATGTHYTPRALTEEIVRHALDPLCYAGPAEGLPPEQWRLRPARELLALKVCDPAMGSGAFLVQACRFLSERLTEAWDAAEAANPGRVVVSPEGALSTGAPEERPLPRDTEERLALARRVVAEHCLYGVDKNPMAVEMAKLSLWLTTVAKGKPFTFLNHRLRCGDSLLGAPWVEVRAGRLRPIPTEIPSAALKNRAARERNDQQTVRGRQRALSLGHSGEEDSPFAADFRRLEAFPDDHEGQQQKEQHYAALRKKTELIRLRAAADVWTASWLLPADADSPTTQSYLQVAEHLGLDALSEPLREAVAHLASRFRFFHWGVEFPDVVAHGGFDALVGNPPFQGGQKITGALGTDYRDYLVACLAEGRKGSADLCSYFFLRAAALLRPGGLFGLIATNTIAQGDTREVGLERLTQPPYHIVRADPSRPWPGAAAVEVSVVWVRRGSWGGGPILDRKPVPTITAYLTPPGAVSGKPFRLRENEGKAFQGSIVLGMGFVLTPDEAAELIERDPRNREVIFPYLNGEDVNSRPDQSPSRWVINFHDWPLARAETYPDCMEIVRTRVRPERESYLPINNWNRTVRERWWLFGAWRSGLAAAMSSLPSVLVVSRVSAHHIVCASAIDRVFSDRLVVLAVSDQPLFGVLTGAIHECWAHRPGETTHETRPTYNPETAFSTYPFPDPNPLAGRVMSALDEWRRAGCLDKGIGLGPLYSLFHRPDSEDSALRRLRELHIQLDEAVAQSYGWSDLDLNHGFHETRQGIRFTVSEAARREILDRLLRLNHERYADECARGLHDAGKKPTRKRATTPAPEPTSAGSAVPAPADRDAALLSPVQPKLFEDQRSLGDLLK